MAMSFGSFLAQWTSPTPSTDEECALVIGPGDNPTALQFSPVGPPVGFPALRRVEIDLSAEAEALPGSIPGTINSLLRFLLEPLRARLDFFATNNHAVYTPADGGYALRVTLAAEPIEPFVRLANPLSKHILSFEISSAVPLKKSLKAVLNKWRDETGRPLIVR